MIVRLTAAAENDLEQIADYIAQDNPQRALSFVQALRDRRLGLADAPYGFPLVSRYERHGIRRRVHGNYLPPARRGLTVDYTPSLPIVIYGHACMDARLQGCTPAWMQVVEPRLEQAAEVVEPRLEQAAEEDEGTVVKGRQVLPDARLQLSHLLSSPLCGNGLSKPLDSSLRWNDGGGCGQGLGRHSI